MGNDFASAIKKLEKEKARITLQLSDINIAIESLTRVNASLNSESHPIYQSESPQKKDKIIPYSDYTVIIPSRYDSDLTLPEMLIYALSVKEGAFAQDAATYIYEIDQQQDLDTLKRRFTDIASSMARAKKLIYKKIGKKFKYFIKDEDILF